jgi:cytochrome c biogenesis protein
MTVESNLNPQPNYLNLLRRWWKQKLLKTIANLKFAIVMLLTIAVFSIVGTVIEQGQSPAYYQTNYPEHPALFGFLTWKVIQVLGLDHVYRTWWYLALLIVFGISLATCTFITQLPMLKSARRWKFYENPKFFQRLALSTSLDGIDLDRLSTELTAKRYRIFREGDKLYARKGIIGKIGPIIVHIGMIITLLGGVWGAMTGFIGQEMGPSGNIFRFKILSMPGRGRVDRCLKIGRLKLIDFGLIIRLLERSISFILIYR